MGYGCRANSLLGFSWQHRISDFALIGSASRLRVNDPIDYASRPRLSSRLTLGGLAFPRNPWAFGGGVSHPSLATHACILTRWRSTSGYPAASLHHRRSSTTRTKYESIASAQDLSPVKLSAQDHSTSELLRTLSRVAASKPTSWLSGHPHIVYH